MFRTVSNRFLSGLLYRTFAIPSQLFRLRVCHNGVHVEQSWHRLAQGGDVASMNVVEQLDRLIQRQEDILQISYAFFSERTRATWYSQQIIFALLYMTET